MDSGACWLHKSRPSYAAAVQERILRNGLEKRVETTGELSGRPWRTSGTGLTSVC
ncbi:hypothetical protein AHiyo8_38730 [Arthrobacter sp. Hiyo8]|nr:hypothetical protein AHiyo8_38730 [Arthrobacter sp. Hiyo8]